MAKNKGKAVWWAGQDTAQLTIPNSFKVIGAASYDYVPVVEELIAKREAGVKGGENIPLTFANHGFIYKFNDNVGPVLTQAIRKAVEKAKADHDRRQARAGLEGSQVLDWPRTPAPACPACRGHGLACAPVLPGIQEFP